MNKAHFARRAISILVCAGVMIGLSAGCTPGCSSGPEPDALRVQLSAEPVSLEPALAEDGIALLVESNLMDGLFGYDGEDKLVPRLAESYTVSEDGRRYEFKLRANARWSDGRAVTAADFVAGLEHAMDPRTGSKLAAMLRPIRGLHGGLHGQDGRLVIELDRPVPYFLEVLTLPVAMPRRADVPGPEQAGGVVTGPYRIVSHRIERRYVLEPNPFYAPKPAISRVELIVGADDSAASNLFDRGRLDILTRIAPTDLVRYRQRGVLHANPFYATYYLGFNLRKAPFNSRDWRRAVAGVVRRDEIANALGSGERPARYWVPFGLEGYLPYSDPAPAFADSVARVRDAVVRSPPAAPVMAAFDSGARNALVMQKVQADLLQGLGLKIDLTNLDWKAYVRSIRTDPAPIFRFGWLAPFADPIMHLQMLTTHDPNNLTGWSNADYDELVDRVTRARPGAAREALVRKAEHLIDHDAPIVPLYHYVQNHAVSARVEDFEVNPFGVIRFDELALKKPVPVKKSR